MAAGKYEVEEERGGYVRNGDILEWRWKQAPSEEPPAAKTTKKPKSAPKKP